MFVTKQASRIVSTGNKTLTSTVKSFTLDTKGLSAKLRTGGNADCYLTAEGESAGTGGYHIGAAEEIEFSGKASIYYNGETNAVVSYLLYDLI